MNSLRPRRLARTCWIALVAMLSLVLLPAVSGALAASASPAGMSWGNVPPAPMAAGWAEGLDDGFDEDAFDLEVDDIPDCLPGALPAALPAAPQAGLPAAAPSLARVHWPERQQRAAWRPRAWPAWMSRGPPRPGA